MHVREWADLAATGPVPWETGLAGYTCTIVLICGLSCKYPYGGILHLLGGAGALLVGLTVSCWRWWKLYMQNSLKVLEARTIHCQQYRTHWGYLGYAALVNSGRNITHNLSDLRVSQHHPQDLPSRISRTYRNRMTYVKILPIGGWPLCLSVPTYRWKASLIDLNVLATHATNHSFLRRHGHFSFGWITCLLMYADHQGAFGSNERINSIAFRVRLLQSLSIHAS